MGLATCSIMGVGAETGGIDFFASTLGFPLKTPVTALRQVGDVISMAIRTMITKTIKMIKPDLMLV
jgi:hypothetical protein